MSEDLYLHFLELFRFHLNQQRIYLGLVDFHEVLINNISREQLLEMTGGHTVPQIQINEKYIGGYSELMQLNQSGKLKEIISNGN